MYYRMKIVWALILLLTTVSAGYAGEDLWVLWTLPDNGYGQRAFQGTIGVNPDAEDGWDWWDSEAPYFIDRSEATRMIAGIVVNSNKAWVGDWRSPAPPWTYPQGVKRWELRVAGMPQATGYIRLVFRNPIDRYPQVALPQSISGTPVEYRVVLVDNRGMPGAPPNGTVWNLPVPSGGPTYVIPDLLPMIALSDGTHEAMINEGYILEFHQYLPGDPPVNAMEVDVKPGEGVGSINLGSRGVVPVAVFGTEDFAPGSINPSSVRFAGAKAVKWAVTDLDADGWDDLVCHFRTRDLDLEPTSTEAEFSAVTLDGRIIQGTDSIRIVPPSKN